MSVHTAAMFVVVGASAVIVYRKVGVDVLRRAWVNLDLVWVVTLVLTGCLTFGVALYRVVA